MRPNLTIVVPTHSLVEGSELFRTQHFLALVTYLVNLNKNQTVSLRSKPGERYRGYESRKHGNGNVRYTGR
jgi:hypothetical protein